MNNADAKKDNMGESIIKACLCEHDFQDQQNGRGMRVFNPIGKNEKGTSSGTHRCTVCGRVVTDNRAKDKITKTKK